MAGETALELLNQLQPLLTNGTDVKGNSKTVKKAACDLAYKLFRELEEPGDLVTRLISQTTENAIVSSAIDLNIFEYLLNRDGNTSSKDIASNTGAEEALVYRILRYLAAHDHIDEIDVDSFKASAKTVAFTMPKSVAGLKFSIDIGIPAWQAIPAYLKSTSYRNPTDPLNSPLQYAFKSEKHFFDILVEQDAMSSFQTFMSDYRADRAELLDIYPADERLLQGFDSSSDAILFVDVGGGRGHEIEKFVGRFPQKKSRMVLQDLPHVVKEVDGSSTMDVMAYDFFTPQPIQGARCYHFRMILHDWPDEYCLKILKNTASAMNSGSKVLISDVVLPDKGATSWPTESDIGMMSLLSAMERSSSQWQSLLERAGLKIVKIFRGIPESVIEAELA